MHRTLSSGGNWGNGSLGSPLDPTAYDEGTLVHPVGVRIQSDPAMGAETVVGMEGLEGAEADSVLGELIILIAARICS